MFLYVHADSLMWSCEWHTVSPCECMHVSCAVCYIAPLLYSTIVNSMRCHSQTDSDERIEVVTLSLFSTPIEACNHVSGMMCRHVNACI